MTVAGEQFDGCCKKEADFYALYVRFFFFDSKFLLDQMKKEEWIISVDKLPLVCYWLVSNDQEDFSELQGISQDSSISAGGASTEIYVGYALISRITVNDCKTFLTCLFFLPHDPLNDQSFENSPERF